MKHKLLAVLTVLLLLTGCTSSPATDDPRTQPASTVLTDAVPVTSETASINTETTGATPAAEPDTVADTVTTETALEETVSRFTETDAPEQTESASEAATHTETKPSETQPTESGQPKPPQPKPSETAPTQPSPSEPPTTEPSTTEPKPTEPTPTPHTHSWGAWQQTKEPTCSNYGTETRSCSYCGQTEARTVPATGNHSWNETTPPTCSAAGIKTCAICGTTENTAALGHDWVHYDEEGHWRAVLTCRCGAVFHTYNEWSAHMDSYLDTAEEGNHTGYESHEEWIIDHPAYAVCSRCGAVK